MEELTKILKVNTNLMHSTCKGLTKDDACRSVIPQFLESCRTIFPFRRYLTHANFVANNLDWLLTFNNATLKGKNERKQRAKNIESGKHSIIQHLDCNHILRKLSLDSTYVLFLYLSIPNLMFHLSRFLWTPTKQQ